MIYLIIVMSLISACLSIMTLVNNKRVRNRQKKLKKNIYGKIVRGG
jgi:hypothetical protein